MGWRWDERDAMLESEGFWCLWVDYEGCAVDGCRSACFHCFYERMREGEMGLRAVVWLGLCSWVLLVCLRVRAKDLFLRPMRWISGCGLVVSCCFLC